MPYKRVTVSCLPAHLQRALLQRSGHWRAAAKRQKELRPFKPGTMSAAAAKPASGDTAQVCLRRSRRLQHSKSSAGTSQQEQQQPCQRKQPTRQHSQAQQPQQQTHKRGRDSKNACNPSSKTAQASTGGVQGQQANKRQRRSRKTADCNVVQGPAIEVCCLACCCSVFAIFVTLTHPVLHAMCYLPSGSCG
jgi:hypothetical protein